MTKTFCDVCGKELTMQEQMNAYNIAITSKHRLCNPQWARHYSEVCEDCAKNIVGAINVGIINSPKEKTND